MKVYILGAGPAGLAVADGLTDNKKGNFILLEKGPNLGGLAQTVKWNQIGSHDLGPHKIFSLDQALVNRVENLLPNQDWLTREKVSSIYMKGHYLPYPPSPFSLAGVFGLPAFVRMVIGYGFAKISSMVSSAEAETFEEDLSGRVGRPLYEHLFKPIAVKLWGDPKTLDVKLSKGRVQTPSLLEVLGRLLKIKKSSQFEALTFRYPKGGLGRIWQAIATKSQAQGKILLEHEVTGLEFEGRKISQILFKSNGVDGKFEIGPDDQVVSTLPLNHTIKIMSKALPPHFQGLAEKVVDLNDLLLVFLHVEQTSLLKESWVFIPDPDVIFHRISEQESFDPAMTTDGSIVCCEIMSSKIRPLAGKSDGELSSLAVDGLRSMGYLFKVLDQKVIRLPKSYPVFGSGFEAGLAEIIQRLDQFENFRSIGRQGAFNYIGTMDAMDIGYGYANWIKTAQAQPWKEERERTNHYPVLD
ncbi:MAG: NAD(P)-binding protein [Bdellovibrionaceae bacterium]|nr:NAD(P)-binding protein [Pseudobdellovibrionaceae bacterium]